MTKPLLLCRLLEYTNRIVNERKLVGLLFALPSSSSSQGLFLLNRGSTFSHSAFYWQANTQGETKDEGQKKKKRETKKDKDQGTDVWNSNHDIFASSDTQDVTWRKDVGNDLSACDGSKWNKLKVKSFE